MAMNLTSERYRKDPVFREFHKKRARINYFRKAIPQRPSPELLQTSYYVDLPIKNPSDARYGKSVRVPVYTISKLADMIDYNPQQLKYWEESGVLPRAMFTFSDRNWRGYTFDQVYAFYDLSPLMVLTDKRGWYHSAFFRRLRERWSQMPDGVVVEPIDSTSDDKT